MCSTVPGFPSNHRRTEVAPLAMEHKVSFQQVLSAKPFRACRANKWALFRMTPHMANKMVGPAVFSFAHTAVIHSAHGFGRHFDQTVT